MSTKITKKAALCAALLLTGLAYSQTGGPGKDIGNPCFTTQHEAYLRKHTGKLSEEQFEKWLEPKLAEAQLGHKFQKSGNSVVTLPVVVHIIHNGDAIGVNENISDAQVFSQMKVLNNDFRRLAGTPGYVEGNAGTDIKIEFCLAQRDPDGNPTNGIDRIESAYASCDYGLIEQVLKPSTQWDPEKYINIWVCNFSGDLEGWYGYATFPEASGLDGFEGMESYAENDGLAIHYKCFGSSDYFNNGDFNWNTNKGRTAVHEMGHFFGLRHIWGDGQDCSATDYCQDTPSALAPNFYCMPWDSCMENEGEDMIENYMDYTPDECKSIFTLSQKDRMWAVLQNAMRRGTLITSDGCQPPIAATQNNALQGLKIYPNPVGNTLNIATDISGVDGQYTIYNLIGQTVARRAIIFETGMAIDISGLSKGAYTIKIELGSQVKTLKFLKE